ncbi:glycosyltransferase family 2 protein [Sulfurirhabdus autotrophica]|uniref:Glycosyltransferase 2-like domain-containing protein n=1 Tax=Sulfurirhabdus autotrophica TaxID=1706046 RepID=A0A4R3XYN4_9PROT|nr:glycosyltransferase family 2 protein [Sulfurirhabdus autotrophica]TCV83438.1 hypothetical protein EDC63_11563 [Sulfurirhabdus autotrophica]
MTKSQESINDPSLGVVVLNWNGKSDTLACLSSLFQCTYRHFYVYVVDNASSDGSVEAIREQFGDKHNLTVLESGGNLGFSGGNNVGMKQAVADGMRYVMLLNNDTEVDAAFLEPLVNTMESDSGVGVVTSKIYFAKPSNKLWFFGGFMDRNTGLGGPVGGQVEDVGQFNHLVECDYATGCALLTSAELIKKIGVLDDDYFYLCEDADFCFRVSDAGYRVVAVPESIVWHKVTASLAGGEESPFRLYFRARNQMMLVAKNKKDFRLIKHGLGLFGYHMVYLARRVAKGMPWRGTYYYIWGLWDFLLGRKGNISQRRSN